MKRNMFFARAIFFACFVLFFFGQPIFAANNGCHTDKEKGCGTKESDIFNVNAYSEPSYSPSWTNVTTSARVYGGQYLRFAVTEGNIYVWTTEGPEDYFQGAYANACSSDSDCSDEKLKCLAGYCQLPFNTELTLLEGNSCSPNSKFLAFSNTNGFRNQSALEWKATMTGIVTLLITNSEYNPSSDSFVGCQKTLSNMTTTVKWQRGSSEHCDSCDVPEDYRVDKTNVQPDQAPSWTTIQSKDWIDITNISQEYNLYERLSDADANWIKPGSYIVFNVNEGEIYRWSTCASVFYDTQLSLFKGEGTDGDCGQFLAYGDDSNVSYKVGQTNYCPAGTKQTVLEWQANFTGKVTLLLNEYNCYQCYKRSITGYNKWAHCFEVNETYKKGPDGKPLMDSDNFPVLADSTTTQAESVNVTYMYAFPIDWQRYDCNTCTQGSPVAKIADFTNSSGWQDFSTGGSQALGEGQYVTFSLKRGSKYLFRASNATSLITIKEGDSCNGKTLAQGKGQITYFADSKPTSTERDPNKIPDIITVFISNAECVSGSNTLTYSYYGATGDILSRYTVEDVQGGKMYTDTTTNTKFVDTGDWAATWKQAIEICEGYAVTSEDAIFPCPQPVCPSTNHTAVQGEDKYCQYNGVGPCAAPVCDNGYREYPKNSQTDVYADSWGMCYYKPDRNDACYGKDIAHPCSSHTPITSQWKNIKCATKKCMRDNEHMNLISECPDGYTFENGRCYGDDESEFHEIYFDLPAEKHPADMMTVGTKAPEVRNSTPGTGGKRNCLPGYTLGEETNQCYKCDNHYDRYYTGYDYKCAACSLEDDPTCVIVDPGNGGERYPAHVSCGQGENNWYIMQEGNDWTCFPCFNGMTPEKVGGLWKCVAECNGIIVNDMCNPGIDPIETCPEGWIEDPQDSTLCRKLNGKHVQCAKSQAVLKDNNGLYDGVTFETCDTNKPNSVDCDCYYDRCESGYIDDDRKVCPTTYNYQGHNYPVTPQVDADGFVTECRFVDFTGSMCGEAIGGWILPNVNQLYSIVDFDLYDPATSLPFSGVAYIRDELCKDSAGNGVMCNSTSNTPKNCAPSENDPFGDAQCGLNGENGDGHWICMDGECVRNNWYWSSTTVTSENDYNGKFIWSVNMQDGRSYRAVKGCSTQEECQNDPGLNARSHKVLCVRGLVISGIFDSDAPSNSQVFSGWACDKSIEYKPLTIYFEITDSSMEGKNVVSLLDASDLIGNIPGYPTKGIKYGTTDITPTTSYLPEKQAEIYNNCGFPQNPAPHAFEIKWNGEVTPGKEEVAEIIQSIQAKECSEAVVNAVYAGNTNVDTDNCAVPPYFVTAYAVNADDSTATALAISPSHRPFVFTNRCGDNYITYDGTYTENCESDVFDRVCVYDNPDCQLCSQTTSGSVQACTLYAATPPSCMDGTLQSQFCTDDGVIAEGYNGAGMPCQYYDFISANIPGKTEECDCNGGTYYLYTDENTFTCNHPLTSKVCPEYYTGTGSEFCYICSGCKREQVAKARCGDGILQKSSCPNDDPNCQEVPGANEECDDGNASNTDGCTNDCKFPMCGDGYIQTNLGEVCDSGQFNGYYATNCEGSSACPGCAGKYCGKNGTDPLGPRCGDGKVQNIALCTADNNTLIANGYANQAEFLEENGFENVAECQQKLVGANEACDLASGNGKAVTFADFIENSTVDVSFCVQEINGVKHPVNMIHERYGECVYLYKQYVAANPGCASDCSAAISPYCGDGTKDPEENCDQSLPNVIFSNGKYLVAEKDLFNGKAYGYCKLDCSGTYRCSNNLRETSDCAGKTEDNFCPLIGDGDVLYVRNGSEACDEGAINGTYGHCSDNCDGRAYCGNGNKTNASQLGDCIEKAPDGTCLMREECDFGLNNRTVENAYSVARYGSCISEDEECMNGVEEWGDRICCQYGRYCGDGTVDNGDGAGHVDGKEWRDASNWIVSAAGNTVSVVSEPRELAVKFTMNGPATATAELNIEFPIEMVGHQSDKSLRYMMEYDLKVVKSANETAVISSGANQYDENGELFEAPTVINGSPYFFVNEYSIVNETGVWKHARSKNYISGFDLGVPNKWYTGTAYIKIVFRMSGDEGTEFYIRGLKFFALENGLPRSVGDASEMCDPGEENFVVKGSSEDIREYMKQCQPGCVWTYYCGDGKIQRGDNCYGYDSDRCEVVYGAEEVCDNGTNEHNVYNGCEPGCFEVGPRCGDGILDRLIECDGCNVPASGLAKEEACDRGAFNSIQPLGNYHVVDITNYNTETAAYGCRDNCMVPRCGDGVLDLVEMYNSDTGQYERVEECDCGVVGSYYDSTKLQKTTMIVGDNVREIEICLKSDGTPLYNTNDGGRAAVCRPNCKISRCGDGILDPDEECDDGNFDDHDSCTKTCRKTSCGDEIFAYNRSYLCEELINKNITAITSFRDKGVIDCVSESGHSNSCTQFVGMTESQVVSFFNSGYLHCCYNPKLEGGTDDHNCEIKVSGNWKTPRDIALENCTTYAYKKTGNQFHIMSEEECYQAGYLDSLEMCENCVTKDCGCAELYPDTTSPNYHKCIDQNKYCDKTCWNRVGGCGDGRVDNGAEGSGTIDAGEACDNHQRNDAGSYTDIYGQSPIPGGNQGIGAYCTGGWVGTGVSDSTRPMCGTVLNGVTVTTDCWAVGCSQRNHGGVGGAESRCGDNIVDVYAGEECDEGTGGNYTTNWCNSNCRWNTTPDQGQARCGDGVVQGNSGEVCDDGNDLNTDYCINNCHTYYGECGDGKITGPGFNLFDSLVSLSAPNQLAGPEYCDLNSEDKVNNTCPSGTTEIDGKCYRGDERSVSLMQTGYLVPASICNNCQRAGTCGDGTRNYRFEGCDFGEGNDISAISKDGKICFAGCKSNPIGGLIRATSAEISGWACDPDHPMVHPNNLVRIRITGQNGVEVGIKTLGTTEDPLGVDSSGINITPEYAIRECGGGNAHGWTFNPSKADASMVWEGKPGPYKIEVYATTLDGAPETDVLIGEKTNFVMAMKCGDAVVSGCSDITVTLANGGQTQSWDTNTVCCDSNSQNCNGVKVAGTCADYGLINNAKCVNETCDNGSNNGDDKECDSKCQVTTCGDGILQNNMTERENEECDQNSPRPQIYCNGTTASGNYPAVDPIVTADIQGSTIGSETAMCNSSTCKWNRSVCTITSPCPALSTVVANWGGNYKPEKASQYIRYYDSQTTYKRNWNSTTNSWPAHEDLKYKEDIGAVCKFECTGNLKWNSATRKCEPKDSLQLQCAPCGDNKGVWMNSQDSCNTTSRTVNQTVSINTNGDVVVSPQSVVTEYHGNSACGWTCNSSSQYHGASQKCFEVAKNYQCTMNIGGSNKTSLAGTNYRWVEALKECNNGNCKVKFELLGENDTLSIPQTIGSSTSTGFDYTPLDADLVTYSLNHATNGALSQLDNLDPSVPKRCYYTCATTSTNGKELFWNPKTDQCEETLERCGNGIVENKDCSNVEPGATCILTPGMEELCDDGNFNGSYGSVNGKSHCNNTCSGRIRDGNAFFCGDGLVQYNATQNFSKTWNFEGDNPYDGITIANINVPDTNDNTATITMPGWERVSGSLGTDLQDALGSYSLCSMNGTTANATYNFANTKADVLIPINSASGGTLTFKYMGSSEANFDYLQVFIDDDDTEVMTSKSKTYTTWTTHSLEVNPGSHTLKFRYSKDGSVNSNADRYCIDDIQFNSGGSTCEGFNCSEVTELTYPGANIDTLVPEECDPADPNSTPTNFCNKMLGLNRTSYYPQGTIECGAANTSNACKLTMTSLNNPTAADYPCGFCGDGYIQDGKEDCELKDGKIYFGSNMDGVAFCNSESNNKSLTQSSAGYSGTVEEFTVQNSGVYEITAIGAQGGNGYHQDTLNNTGCYGTKMMAQYKLTKGQKLRFIAGKKGDQGKISEGYTSGGGGGGSFVVLCKTGTCTTNDIELLIAAGGGGGADGDKNVPKCKPGQTGLNGASGGTNGASGGTNGADGTSSNGYSSGGKGWNDHKSAFTSTPSEMYGTYGTEGSYDGGFGGGGKSGYGSDDSGWSTVYYSYAGGGGGYSGGGAGTDDEGGGGGGSYINESPTYYVGSKSSTIASAANGSVSIKMIKHIACTENCQASTAFVFCGQSSIPTALDFESGDSITGITTNPGTADTNWLRMNSSQNNNIGANSGTFSMCSNNYNISNAIASLTVNVTMPAAGNFSFYIKGQGEGGYDKFTLTVDDDSAPIITSENANNINIPGTNGNDKTAKGWTTWTKQIVPLGAGNHTLVFNYAKDSSVNVITDRFCIDDLMIE